MAHTIHYGPYESCETTYLKLFGCDQGKRAPDLRANS
jgi:hypothetical protein